MITKNTLAFITFAIIALLTQDRTVKQLKNELDIDFDKPSIEL